MKTYLIDWGKNADGARFALLQTRNLDRALLDLDAEIGEPESVTEFQIPLNPSSALRYMEIGVME